jgi:hypothetical protein
MLPNSPSINNDLKLWMHPQVDKFFKKIQTPFALTNKNYKNTRMHEEEKDFARFLGIEGRGSIACSMHKKEQWAFISMMKSLKNTRKMKQHKKGIKI